MYAFYKKHEYLFAGLFVLISQLAVLPTLSTHYPDTDNYTHARRVLDLIQSGVWAETPYMHSNYPFGEILHFTRITDVFWLFFSLPAFLFFPVKEAVYWGGYIYQTGVLVLSALALIWALKPFTDSFLRLLALCLFFLQPSVTETYILIKPDHHALTALFAFITIGGLTNYLIEKQIKYLKIAGIAAGLGLWTSIEGVLIFYSTLAGLALLFILNKESVKACLIYSFYYCVGSFVCLAVNPPVEGFFFPDNGRLSFLLVFVAGLTAAAFGVLYTIEKKNPAQTFLQKGLTLSLLSAASVLILFAFYPPAIVFSPYFPPAIKEIWADNVVELQSSLARPVLFFLGSFPSIIGLISALFIFKFCDKEQRRILILTFIPLLFFTLLSLKSIRYARLSSLFTIFPMILAFSLRWRKDVFTERKKSVLLTLIYVLTTAYLGINYISVNKSLTLKERPLLQVVKPYLPDGEGSILSDTFLGPEIIWELDEKVIGTPYHRNVGGIADGAWALNVNDTRLSADLMKRHRVKAILLFMNSMGYPEMFWDMHMRYSFFSNSEKDRGLIVKLMSGRDLPCGIEEELNTPPPYMLYTVDFSKCSDAEEAGPSPEK